MLTVIDSRQKISAAWLRELWEFRGLFATLVARDIKVRYKQTAVGILWAVIQPVILMLIFTAFFARYNPPAVTLLPYPLFVFSGLLFWQLFSGSVNSASVALASNQALIQKIYMPRLLLPLSKIGVHAVDFLFGLAITAGLCAYYNIGSWRMIPAFAIAFLIALAVSSGLGCLFSVLTVRYRDVRFIIPFFIQITLFISPVIYPSKIIIDHNWLLFLNPLTGAIEAARASIIGMPLDGHSLLISSASALAILAISLIYFKRGEQDIADII